MNNFRVTKKSNKHENQIHINSKFTFHYEQTQTFSQPARPEYVPTAPRDGVYVI